MWFVDLELHQGFCLKCKFFSFMVLIDLKVSLRDATNGTTKKINVSCFGPVKIF